MQVQINVYAETDDPEVTVPDAVESMERTLPYIFDNVIVTSNVRAHSSDPRDVPIGSLYRYGNTANGNNYLMRVPSGWVNTAGTRWTDIDMYDDWHRGQLQPVHIVF